MDKTGGGGLAERLIAVCCGLTILALWVVGVCVHEVVRHLIQSAPLFIGVVFGFRGSGLARAAGLALGLFWAGIAGLIALHLTGVAHIINGSFSPREVAMVWIIGLASGASILLALVARSRLSLGGWIAVFAVVAAVQVGAMALGLSSGFAHDRDLFIQIDDDD
jgi:hypothetical protein